MSMQISAPLPLTATHQLDGFNCGEPLLDDWLKRRALTNHLNGASRTFVVVDPDQCVL
ncbi:MAG: GNAT family N-acetyltransferase, partial [Betaproteobacteria bacterium]|nr:GNAT family N-acetyltransferase [Betaproteobacteria bacterium]